LDPKAAARVLGHDPQRLLRIVSVAQETDKPLSAWQADTKPVIPPGYWTSVLLLPPRELLYERINQRFDGMVTQGGLAEVEALAARNLASDLGHMRSIGYVWLGCFSFILCFWLARFVGAARVEAISGKFLARIIALVRRNGFLTSFAVRLVPTGPFVLVNMAAGVSGLRFASFAAGTALGIVPKILVVALLGQGALTAAEGEQFMVFALLGAFVVVGAMLLARRLLQPHINAPD